MTSLLAFVATRLGRLHPRPPGGLARRTGAGEQPVREPLSRTEIERELRLPPGERWSGVRAGPRTGY